MALNDSKTNFDAPISLTPAARTATANGTGVGLANYGTATAVAAMGTVTDGTHTLKLQESDDNATFADVAASDQVGAFTAVTSASSNTVQRVGYIGIKPYIRAVTTVAGATTGGVYAVLVVRGNARVQPVA